jgi:Flp pilus assembly protein TadG
MPNHHRPKSATRRHERGLSVILVAILGLLLVGFVGLAVDAGHVYTAGGQLQDAADAAALAAARQVLNDTSPGGTFQVTRDAAAVVAAANKAAGNAVLLDANMANDANGDIVVGTWDAVAGAFTPTTSSPNAVKVLARCTQDSPSGALGLFFGGAFGVLSSDVSRSAIALASPTSSPVVHVDDPLNREALLLSGTANLDAGNGKVQVNSCDKTAIHLNGTPNLWGSAISTNGGAKYPAGSIHGTLSEYAPTLPDPLAHILPDAFAFTALRNSLAKPKGNNGSITTSGTYTPGYYPKGLDIKSTTSVTLKPGTYVFGTKANLNGSAKLLGDGVTILFDQNVALSVGGGAAVDISPPTSGQFTGLSMMFHRSTSSASACTLGGTGVIDVEGSLYVPKGTLKLHGTGGLQNVGQAVCFRLEVKGKSAITSKKVVPPQDGGSVYLVD